MTISFGYVIRTAAIAAAVLLSGVFAAYGRSDKRGVCWDESNGAITEHHASLLSPGVAWVYNWGPDAANSAVFDSRFVFVPMAWNGAYNESRIRTWLQAHPECKYLLAFNEPNFADQARMTPAQAAAAWPTLKAIAADFGLRLVAPALNFSNSQVGGRVWNPYEWYDEFFRLVPDAGVDCLAMHSYMNWYSANTWLATEYFYTDLYTPGKDCYGRYPNLVAYLDGYKTAHGHFPRMMLTEFCSWENDGAITGVDFQIDQMTQKVQKLEQSDLVEGYAWFMANPAGGAGAYPYMSILERNTASSGLSDLGTVYVYMSDFDTDRHYAPCEIIAAKDYVDATTDNQAIRVRPNTDAASDAVLQIEIPSSGYPQYQIDVPADGTYTFTFRLKTSSATTLMLYVDNRKLSQTAADSNDWTEVTVDVALTAGQHRVMLYNGGSASIYMNAFHFDAKGAGVEAVTIKINAPATFFDLSGRQLTAAPRQGLYIVRQGANTYKITK